MNQALVLSLRPGSAQLNPKGESADVMTRVVPGSGDGGSGKDCTAVCRFDRKTMIERHISFSITCLGYSLLRIEPKDS